jgi:hypothetical protein
MRSARFPPRPRSGSQVLHAQSAEQQASKASGASCSCAVALLAQSFATCNKMRHVGFRCAVGVSHMFCFCIGDDTLGARRLRRGCSDLTGSLNPREGSWWYCPLSIVKDQCSGCYARGAVPRGHPTRAVVSGEHVAHAFGSKGEETFLRAEGHSP